ncbi:MAG: glutathione S-transferase N-terminal domain-containing protein [Alphaproteobacteria bacterium]
MSRTLYELTGKDDRRFSPYCWRVRMALAHKGLAADYVAVNFTDKETIAFSGQEKVPVLTDGAATVSDSFAIACYLDDTYPDRPALFGNTIARGEARVINHWTNTVLHAAIQPLVIDDIYRHLNAADQPYFMETRAGRFDRPFDQVQANRDTEVVLLRNALAPLRLTLAEQPYLCGDAPAFADYIVFGAFQWARSISPFKLFEESDPVRRWRDRLLVAFDRAGYATNAYDA